MLQRHIKAPPTPHAGRARSLPRASMLHKLKDKLSGRGAGTAAAATSPGKAPAGASSPAAAAAPAPSPPANSAARLAAPGPSSLEPLERAPAASAVDAAPPAEADDDAPAHPHEDTFEGAPEGYPGFEPMIASRADYERMYRRSVEDPDAFWGELAEEFDWKTKWEPKHTSWNFDTRQGPIRAEFFRGATTNVCHNALDRHVAAGRGGADCFLWEGNDAGRERKMTYSQVLEEVCRLSNWLRSQGVKKGDAVSIYMPMLCELPVAMLACARVGAVHSVVFGGFSAEALAQRVEDCRARVLITCSGVKRGDKRIGLKAIADEAVALCKARGHEVARVLVCENDNGLPKSETPFDATGGRDGWWRDEVSPLAPAAEVEWVEAEHPLFLLYTSGSTGKPKGVLHTTGGYMVYAATTTRYAFNLRAGDVFWCTADCGWITGHSYVAYGPLLVGCAQVVFEGVPTYPDAGRCWEVVDKYSVGAFYTAPTAIRSLMRSGDALVRKHSRASLRVLGSVGEPINPEAWRWYHDVVGGGRCPVVDTWWQTETGGHMILPLPGAWRQKPGSATLPFFGVVPALLNDKGEELEGAAEGYLAVKQAWPAALRTLYGDQDRFEKTYFGLYPGFYFSGDGARRDADGYYWITGRVDDVINVSGHRVGTAEVESALVAHPAVAEAAVVGVPHAVKGEGIYAYVLLMEGAAEKFPDPAALKKLLVQAVRSGIGAFAAPDVIHVCEGLPKTRSGKIMRRVLRKIAAGLERELGDTSTLADPSVVEQLVASRRQGGGGKGGA